MVRWALPLIVLAFFFMMNSFDVLVWAALIRIAARILAGGSARLWLAFGVIAGLALTAAHRALPSGRH